MSYKYKDAEEAFQNAIEIDSGWMNTGFSKDRIIAYFVGGKELELKISAYRHKDGYSYFTVEEYEEMAKKRYFNPDDFTPLYEEKKW